jgi:hypothetical protein
MPNSTALLECPIFRLMNKAIARVTKEDCISHISQLQQEDFCKKKKKKKRKKKKKKRVWDEVK